MLAEKIIMAFGPGGEIRAVQNDDYPFLAVHPDGEPAQRASNVENIKTGPYKDYWYADMSLMGPGWEYCLWPQQPTRRQALRQEHDHLVENWIKHGKEAQGRNGTDREDASAGSRT